MTQEPQTQQAKPVLVIATHNPGKRVEFAALLAGAHVELRDLSSFPGAPEVAEHGATYRANAHAKAHSATRFTGLPALADDSGLEVDALGGAPGVRSARFAAPEGQGKAGDATSRDGDNIALLLARLREVPAQARTACFRCVIVVAHPDGRELMAEGTCEGLIAAAPRGSGGFGYDPVFYDPARGVTFGEISASEKQLVSHRARACAQLRPHLHDFLAQHGA